jgi:hypothetical protein
MITSVHDIAAQDLRRHEGAPEGAARVRRPVDGKRGGVGRGNRTGFGAGGQSGPLW